MFMVNHQTNRISPVKTKKFSGLGFSERKYLQEWLAYQPDALLELKFQQGEAYDGL